MPSKYIREESRRYDVRTNVPACDILVGEFLLQSRYCVDFWTDACEKWRNSIFFPAMAWIVPLLFYKEVFGIKQPKKVLCL